MAIDRFVDSILDYFRLPEHKKNAPPGVGARIEPSGHQPIPNTTPPAAQAPGSAPVARDIPATVPPPSAARQALEASRSQSTPVAPPAQAPAVDEDPIRILLVEDDPKWAKLVQAYVNAINGEHTLGMLELVWVETLEATLEKLRTRSYDLIFLDLMLPDSQGIATLDSVWAKASRVQTPVVVMSNLDSGGVMDRVREVTGRDILLKKNISKKVLFGQIDFNVFED